MIFVDFPYASKFLNETIITNQFEVVDTPSARQLLNGDVNYIDNMTAAELLKQKVNPKAYMSSENSIRWIIQNLSATEISRQVQLFKDKVKFRDLLKELFPDYFYQAVDLNDIESLNLDHITTPFIIKPAIGFFSLGVYRVNSIAEWEIIRSTIKNDIEAVKSLYPREVLDTTTFIIEEYIEGQEYAVDVYFNQNGKPVILNILKHIFAGDNDVSDRVYLTSKEIILDNLTRFDSFLCKLSGMVGLKDFVMHMEVRIDSAGNLMPIEINPMRFGGWCTTGDFTWYCFAFNSYECFWNNIEPNWTEILKDKNDYIYSLIVLNNSTGTPGQNINQFDYDDLLNKFEKPLELRKVDYKKFPLFGFLFTRTNKSNYQEIEYILKSDLCEFIN